MLSALPLVKKVYYFF